MAKKLTEPEERALAGIRAALQTWSAVREKAEADRATERAPGEEAKMVSKDGPDGQILTIAEAAEVLGETPERVAHVVGGGGVSPAHIVGGRPLVRRSQLGAIREALEGKTKARDGFSPLGPGLVSRGRSMAEGEQG